MGLLYENVYILYKGGGGLVGLYLVQFSLDLETSYHNTP